MCIKIRQLGLDFGSSVTSVVGFSDEHNRPILFESGSNSKLYTAIAKEQATDEYVYFADAFRYGNKAGYNFSTTIKEDVTKKDASFALEFLKNVFRIVKNTKGYDFSELECICYGFPRYVTSDDFDKYRIKMNKILSSIAKEIFAKDPQKGEVSVISCGEPVLALIACKWIRQQFEEMSCYRNGDKILVLDFGGNTFDMSLVKITENDAIRADKLESVRLLTFGTGKFIDLMISSRAGAEVHDSGVEQAKIELFNNPKKKTSLHPLKYKSGESISLKYSENDSKILIYVYEQGTQQKQSVMGMGMIYENLGESIKKFLHDSNQPGYSIKHVLFTGGTSRISYLRYHILDEIKYWLRDDVNIKQIDEEEKIIFIRSSSDVRYSLEATEPLAAENAVALGAALVASKRVKLDSESVGIAKPENGKGLTALQIRQINSAVDKLMEIDDISKEVKDALDLLCNLPSD